jgi:amino acid transporter
MQVFYSRQVTITLLTISSTNRMIGTAIFSTPSAIAASVGSAGAALTLWVAGLILAYCGLYIWIELGSLMPRSGGEKVYLDAAYPKPPMLVTTVFAVHVIFLGFTGDSLFFCDPHASI